MKKVKVTMHILCTFYLVYKVFLLLFYLMWKAFHANFDVKFSLSRGLFCFCLFWFYCPIHKIYLKNWLSLSQTTSSQYPFRIFLRHKFPFSAFRSRSFFLASSLRFQNLSSPQTSFLSVFFKLSSSKYYILIVFISLWVSFL